MNYTIRSLVGFPNPQAYFYHLDNSLQILTFTILVIPGGE